MQATGLNGKILGEFIFRFVFLGLVEIIVCINFYDAGSHIGEDEEGHIFLSFGEILGAAFGEFHAAVFFIYGKEEWLIYKMHIFALLLHVVVLRLLQHDPNAFFAQEFDKRPIFGQCTVDAQQCHAGLTLLVARFAFVIEVARLQEILGSLSALRFNQALHKGL